jgi:hypothetical protein
MSPNLDNLQKKLLKNGTAIGWIDSLVVANTKHYNQMYLQKDAKSKDYLKAVSYKVSIDGRSRSLMPS